VVKSLAASTCNMQQPARIMRAFTCIQIGPRRLELPPNIPLSDLCRQVRDAVVLAFYLEFI